MAQNIGQRQAKTVADVHEDEGQANGQDPNERLMDEANNAEGRACALEKNPLTCQQRCRVKYQLGGLFGMGGAQLKP